LWTLSLIALVVLFMSLFPSFSKDTLEINNLLQSLPEALRKAIGIEIESFTSILGFYSYTFVYISLCGAIQAMILGASVVSKEVREKTVDFLLTKPISRSQVITSKLLAVLSSLVLTCLIYIIAAFLITSYVKTEDFSEQAFLLLSISLLFVQIMFSAIGLIASLLFPKIKSVLSLSLGVVFAFFFLGMFGSTIGETSIRYLTPFKYFDTAYIVEHLNYEWSYLFIGALWVTVLIIASFLIYTKKDMDAL